MKPLFRAFIALLFATTLSAQAQSLYWDSNDVSAGAGATPTGTWGTDNFWSANAAGTIATGAWTDGNTAVFAAGNDATSAYTVTVTGTQTAAGINFEEGAVTLTNGTINLTGAATINVAVSNAVTVSSVVGGTVGVTKTGAGTLTLGANNTFTGGIKVYDGGVLSYNGENSATVGNPNPLGAAPSTTNASAITLTNGGTLRCTKQGNAAGSTSFAFTSRGITLGAGGGALEVTDASTNRSVVYGGVIAGAGTMTKKGPGMLYLTGANTYSGNTTNSAGTIRFSTTTALGASASRLVLTGGNILVTNGVSYRLVNPLTMRADATVFGATTNSTAFKYFAFASSSISTVAGTLSIRNLSIVGSTAAFQCRFTNGGFTFSRPIVIGVAGENEAQLDFFTDVPVNDQTFSGVISGPGSIRRSCIGDGTGGRTIVSGANTYSGGTTINGGHIGVGVDSVGSPVTSGALGTGTVSIGLDANAGFFASGGAHTLGNDILFGTGVKFTVSGSNALTFSGNIDLNNAGKTLVISNTALTTISGQVLGTAGGTALTKDGPGTLALNGNNSFSGDTLVSAGQLLVNSALGNVSVAGGATLGGNGVVTGSIEATGAGIAPGANGVGQLTGQNGLNLGSGQFNWQLGAAADDSNGTAGVDFDQFSLTGGTLTAGGSSVLTIGFSTPSAIPDFANPFWQVPRKWTIVKLSGSATNPNHDGFPTVQTNIFVYAGSFASAVEANGDISVTFTPAGLTGAILLSSPANKSVIQSSNATFTVSATGTAPLSYQWYFSNQPIIGPNGSVFTIGSAQLANQGSYFAVVSNSAGAVTSAVATLTVLIPPSISTQPQSQTVEPGTNASFSVSAGGTAPLAYQWKFNGTNIAGATNTGYSIATVATNQAGNYSVVITNIAGSITSSNALLTIGTPAPPVLSGGLTNDLFTLRWTSVINKIYRAQFKADLTATNWTDIVPDVAATGSTASITNNVNGQNQRYYRVLLLP